MKKYLITLLSIFWIVLPCVAQSDIEKYSERYDKGERGVTFLKEYVTLLNSGKNLALLEKVADSYLTLVPIKERYSDFNLTIFIAGVRKYDDRAFVELMENWSSCVDDKNDKQLKEKVKNVYATELFNCAYNNRKSTKEFRENMQNNIGKIGMPVADLYRALLDLRYAVEVADFKTINSSIKKIVYDFDKKLYQGWIEMMVMSSAFNLMLEEGDIEQSKAMLEILKPLKTDNVKYFITSVCNSLEGKIVMSK